jgi:leader peptidase (prepilin peptidase)/N-methyltransferase
VSLDAIRPVDLLALLRHPVTLGVLGAMVGSFLNVVIHRVPRGVSVVTGGSHCPQCEKPIRPWDNVPILSWLWLRGRCRACGAPISARYPTVEALTAALFVVTGWWAPSLVALAFMLPFVSAMVVITFIDHDHMIIPDSITIPGMAAGIAAAFLGAAVRPAQAVVGLIVGGGGLLAVAVAYRAATGRHGVGGGDIKLLGMVGAFLGPVGAFLTIMVGSVAGTLFACALMLRGRASRTAELPFGTFLAPGAVLVLFLGARIVDVYWGLF